MDGATIVPNRDRTLPTTGTSRTPGLTATGARHPVARRRRVDRAVGRWTDQSSATRRADRDQRSRHRDFTATATRHPVREPTARCVSTGRWTAPPSSPTPSSRSPALAHRRHGDAGTVRATRRGATRGNRGWGSGAPLIGTRAARCRIRASHDTGDHTATADILWRDDAGTRSCGKWTGRRSSTARRFNTIPAARRRGGLRDAGSALRARQAHRGEGSRVIAAGDLLAGSTRSGRTRHVTPPINAKKFHLRVAAVTSRRVFRLLFSTLTLARWYG